MTAVPVQPPSHVSHSHRVDEQGTAVGWLDAAVEHAAHYLPAQGPITVFIHHNTLHAFEDLAFEDAVQRGAALFDCEPFLSEDRYRQELQCGRIRPADLAAVLHEDLGERAAESILGLCTRYELRWAMLQHPLWVAPSAELQWFVAETDALTRFRADQAPAARERVVGETRHWAMRDLRVCVTQASDFRLQATAGANMRLKPEARSPKPDLTPDPLQIGLCDLFDRFGRGTIERWSHATWEAFSLQALFRVCTHGVRAAAKPLEDGSSPVRHRNLLLAATGEDSDALVNEVLIPLCAAFLDQGLAPWPLPRRDEGFYRAFCGLYRRAAGPPQRWLHGLAQELAHLEDAGIGPRESILESLDLLGVGQGERDEYLAETLLALRGWAGMVRQAETRPDRVAHPAPPGSLVEFLAVRLILERFAVSHVARTTLEYEGPLSALRQVVVAAEAEEPEHGAKQSDVQRGMKPRSSEQRAFLLFQLAQFMGWPAPTLLRLTLEQWSGLLAEVDAFGDLQRRRIFHLAYERRYRLQSLDAVAVHAGRSAWSPRPRFQIVCCIDEREESFRRHLEELAPEFETFGVAGFFSMAMYYRGAADAHYVPLCPPVIQPQHWVTEEVVEAHEDLHERRSKVRRALGAARHSLHVGSRTFTLGALLTAGLGVLASIPLLARVLLPRWASRVRRSAGRIIELPANTHLQLERDADPPGPDAGHIGLTLTEMAGVVERVLRDIGLTSGFAPLVFIVGHGSSSLNNPHESAHDCGACGGSRGGPNARAFAQMANDPRVREVVARSGLAIPADTIFVGAYHNTCDDSLALFDLDCVPASHRPDLDRARSALERAREMNAHERCRRFESAPLDLSPEAALRHVEARAEDLAQVRPEYGHATNSLCIVGRRSRTRGLFLDRRAFLISYDPTQDDAEQAILTRILQAVVPVCAGISLEYYFSYVDPAGFGCSTKLPHNITSLLGVMDGAASDLRTGLPWQMVEVHDPMRLLFVIETTPEAMLRIIERQPVIGRVFRNAWVQLATLSPESDRLHVYLERRFEPYTPETTALPRAACSADWYRGWREHLDYAEIGDW